MRTSNVQRPTSNVEVAERALPLMNPAQRAEAEQLITELSTTNAEELSDFHREAAEAFEKDLQPVGNALAAALHAGTDDALRGLVHLLPGLLREVNRAPALVPVLISGLGSALLAGYDEIAALSTANAVAIAAETHPTDALNQLRRRTVFETDLSSAELRSFSQGLRNRSIFSARTTNADYLEEVKGVVDDILSGKINQATGRLRLLGKLRELGYDPAIGFPDDMANIPPAERGSLQDLSSTRRLDLLIETNVRMAANYGRMVAGNSEYALRHWPAWELVRNFQRETPRGFRRVREQLVADPQNAWLRRWSEAGEEVLWEGAIREPMIARKDSPLWQALGDGAGGHADTLLNPFPPFAFRSGMGWRPVTREECRALRLLPDDETPAPMAGSLSPGEKSIVAACAGLSPELQAELKRELAELA